MSLDQTTGLYREDDVAWGWEDHNRRIKFVFEKVVSYSIVNIL